MRLWKARNEWANVRTRNFTKSRVTQGGSLLNVLRLSQAVCSALLFKVRSLLWLDVVVFAPTLKNRSHYWVRLKRTSTAIRPGREANDVYLLVHVVALLLWQTYVGLWIWTSSSKDWEKRTHFNRNPPCVTRDLVEFRVSTLYDFVKTFKFFPQILFLNFTLLYFSLYSKLIDIGL